jgi:hypothetical protein
VCFAFATGALVLNAATFQEWSDFIKWVFGIYAAGNVGEHISEKDNKQIKK